MRTAKSTDGYDRLIPETRIERGLISAVICGALDGKEIRVQKCPSLGMVVVKNEWDDDGRIKVEATVQPSVNGKSTYTFHAWVEDRNDYGLWVAWEGESAPIFPGGRPGTRKGFAPELPLLTLADLA